jgi:hypothetical protein
MNETYHLYIMKLVVKNGYCNPRCNRRNNIYGNIKIVEATFPAEISLADKQQSLALYHSI